MRQTRCDKPTVEELLLDKLSYDNYCEGSDNSEEIQKMRQVLARALLRELTFLQRYCLVSYYMDGFSMKEIAEKLSVHPSTVTRHIKRALEKLKHIAEYY